MPQRVKVLMGSVKALCLILLRDAAITSYEFLKIMIPISAATKFLNDFGVVEILGQGLGPVMQLVGLPGSMGLVWATALVTNIYGSIAVFATLAPGANLTVAQVTVLSTMILVAHGLPLELRIAQKSGARLRMMFLIRVAGALVLGALLNQIYSHGQFLQYRESPIWDSGPLDPTWMAWIRATLRTCGMVFTIILTLLIMMKILKNIGITDLLTRLLLPVLRLLGMSREAAPVTIIGMLLGISYGGSLIIKESKSGRMSHRDIFTSLALMGLIHSIIEDTLILKMIGGHSSGILWGRLLFALFVIFVLNQGLRRLSEPTFDRYFFRPPTPPDSATPA